MTVTTIEFAGVAYDEAGLQETFGVTAEQLRGLGEVKVAGALSDILRDKYLCPDDGQEHVPFTD